MSTTMGTFLDEQKREALGPVNKWYCSQFYGYEVTEPEQLLSYYIKHGGASHFRQVNGTKLYESVPDQNS
jgi:hypothetical protein